MHTSFHEAPTTRQERTKDLYAVAFNPFLAANDIPQLMTAGGPHLTIYDMPSGNSPATPLLQFAEDKTTAEQYYTCCWVRDEHNNVHYAAAAGEHGQIRIVEVQRFDDEGEEDAKSATNWSLLGQTFAINHMEAHPTFPLIVVTAGKDASLRMWNIKARTQLVQFGGDKEGHQSQIICASINATGDLLASAGMDHKMCVWPLAEANQLCARSTTEDDPQLDLLCVPLTIGFTTDVHSDYIDCVAWCGELIVSKSVQGVISIWKLSPPSCPTLPRIRSPMKAAVTNVRLVANLEMRDSRNWFEKFAIRGSLLACGNDDGKVSLWRLDRLSPKYGSKPQPPHAILSLRSSVAVRQIALNPDGRAIVAVCNTSDVYKWYSK